MLAVVLHIVGIVVMQISQKVGSGLLFAGTVGSALIVVRVKFSAYFLEQRTWEAIVFVAVFAIGLICDIVLGVIFTS